MFKVKLLKSFISDFLSSDAAHLPLPKEHLEICKRTEYATEVCEEDVLLGPPDNDNLVALNNVMEVIWPLHFGAQLFHYFPWMCEGLELESRDRKEIKMYLV